VSIARLLYRAVGGLKTRTMFFSRCAWSGRYTRKWLKNEQLRGSQVVPVKTARSGADEPNLGGRAFQIQSQVVLYKKLQAALAVALPLQLPVSLGGCFMRLPVRSLVVGMGVTPFLPAVVDHTGIHRVGLDLAAMVFGAAAALAVRLAAETLVGSILRWMERLLATAATARQMDSPGSLDPLR
jgi:hypothetical protein